MSDAQPPAEGYELTMPFVVDFPNLTAERAFTMGWRCCHVWDNLSTRTPVFELTVEPEIIDQCDLIAMHFGYVATATTHPDGTVSLRFVGAWL